MHIVDWGTHCVAHQCWHIHDPTHDRHTEESVRVAGNPMLDVYTAIDGALAKLLEAAGDADVLVKVPLAVQHQRPGFRQVGDEIGFGAVPGNGDVAARAARGVARRGGGFRLTGEPIRSLIGHRSPISAPYRAMRHGSRDGAARETAPPSESRETSR